MEQLEREVLINHIPKTDFEKLLFTRKYAEFLKSKNDILENEKIVLKADIDRLKSILKELVKSDSLKRKYLQTKEQYFIINKKYAELKQKLSEIK